MKYNKVYRGQFYNQETSRPGNLALGVVITVDIYDTTSGEAVAPTNIIAVDLADVPALRETIDNEEDKFKAIIRSISLEVQLKSSDSIGIETFVDGGDTRFYAEAYTNSGHYIIKGWVSVSDVQEEFQPDPNTIPITITDGLGFTADEELSDEDGSNLIGTHELWYYLRFALLKTGLSLPATAVYNIRQKTALTLNTTGDAAGHFFKHESLIAKTLEGDNVGTMLKASEVINRLLPGAFITQYNGRWWIVRLDEIQFDTSYNLTLIDEDGNFSDSAANNYIKFVKDGNPLSWMNDDPIRSAERAIKKLELKSTYEFPKEVPCNIDFERGTGPEPTGSPNETFSYDLQCWSFLREGSVPEDLDSAPFAGSTGVLIKRYEYNYEKDRYLVNGTAGGFRHYFKSQEIRMAEKSKIQIGFQFRSATDTAAVTMNVAHMRLVGDDGNVYDWRREFNTTSKKYDDFWDQKSVTDPVFDSEWQFVVDGVDESEWQSVSGTSLPVPVSGNLYIRLLNDLSTPNRHFSGLKVEYIPLVNGSYAKYTGERHTVEQTGDVKALREDELFIGSFPDPSMKGCLLKRGEDREIFSGTVSFGTSGQFEISGDKRSIFQPYLGQKIIIEGSSGNDQEAVILSINYSTIGNTTTIFTDGTTTTELSVSITVSVATYDKAELFYDAAVLPDGPFEDAQSKPFGEMISFDMWNQYSRVMRKFEGTIDGLESDGDIPHLIHKYVLSDPDANTGTRAFMALHFSQELHNCEMDIFLHEVHNPVNPKVYTGHTFKYLTS